MYRSSKHQLASRTALQLFPGGMMENAALEFASRTQSEIGAHYTSVQEQLKTAPGKPSR